MYFIQGRLYHVYNRGVNRDKVFFEADNYTFFLRKLKKELSPFCNILAYCLMPNHYHLLIEIKEADDETTVEAWSKRIARKVGTVQSSYTQAINRRFNRVGSLFQQKAKAKVVDEYAATCFHYIHKNPVEAGLAASMEAWEYSSFKEYVTDHPTGLVNKDSAFACLDIPRNSMEFIRESKGVIVSDKLDFILWYLPALLLSHWNFMKTKLRILRSDRSKSHRPITELGLHDWYDSTRNRGAVRIKCMPTNDVSIGQTVGNGRTGGTTKFGGCFTVGWAIFYGLKKAKLRILRSDRSKSHRPIAELSLHG